MAACRHPNQRLGRSESSRRPRRWLHRDLSRADLSDGVTTTGVSVGGRAELASRLAGGHRFRVVVCAAVRVGLADPEGSLIGSAALGRRQRRSSGPTCKRPSLSARLHKVESNPRSGTLGEIPRSTDLSAQANGAAHRRLPGSATQVRAGGRAGPDYPVLIRSRATRLSPMSVDPRSWDARDLLARGLTTAVTTTGANGGGRTRATERRSAAPLRSKRTRAEGSEHTLLVLKAPMSGASTPNTFGPVSGMGRALPLNGH